MSQRQKLVTHVDKAEFQREAARLLEQFLQSDVDEQVPVRYGKFESKDNDAGRSNYPVKQRWDAQCGGDGVETNKGMSSDGMRHLDISGAVFFGNFDSKDHGPLRFQGLDDGVERKGADDVTEDEDDIPQGVLEGPRTELEQELVRALRHKADDIDRNGDLKAKVRLSMQDVTDLLVYSSFTSTVQKYAENLVGWSRIAFVFELTKKAVHAAGRGGLNAGRIKENCLRYIADKSADWIVRHGGWASMLSGDSDDSTPELD